MADVLGYVVSKGIAESEGLPSSDASRVALIGALRPFNALTALLVQTVARQQAPAPAPAPAATGEKPKDEPVK